MRMRRPRYYCIPAVAAWGAHRRRVLTFLTAPAKTMGVAEPSARKHAAGIIGVTEKSMVVFVIFRFDLAQAL